MKHNPIDNLVDKLKSKFNATDIEIENDEDKSDDIRIYGSFNIASSKYQFLFMSGDAYSFITMEYKIKIDHNKSAIKLYKSANHVNSTCPGIKCVIDSHDNKSVHITLSNESSSKGVIDLEPILDMVNVLPSGVMFFIDGMNKEV